MFGPRNNSLRDFKMKMHWFVFSLCMTHWQLSPVFCHSWLTSNILSELSDFGSSLLFLSPVSSAGRLSFILHAADHSSPSLSFLPPSSPSPFPHRCLLFSSPSLLPVYCCGVGISRIPGKRCISDHWPGSFTPGLLHARHPSPQSERWG